MRHHHQIVVEGHPHPHVALLTIVEQVVDELGGSLAAIAPGLDGATPAAFAQARRVLSVSDAMMDDIRLDAVHLATLVFD